MSDPEAHFFDCPEKKGWTLGATPVPVRFMGGILDVAAWRWTCECGWSETEIRVGDS